MMGKKKTLGKASIGNRETAPLLFGQNANWPMQYESVSLGDLRRQAQAVIL